MAPPPSTAISPLVTLALRILTFVCLLITIIVLVTSSFTDPTDYGYGKIRFKDFYAYRYLLASATLGIAYTLLQTALNILLVATGNRVGGDSMILFDFYADKLMSYVLATGAAAGFGLTVDNGRGVDNSEFKQFIHKAEAASSLCLLAFLFAAISSIFSSFALPKRVQ